MALGVMLYLTFFLLRDGERLGRRVAAGRAAPSRARGALMTQFAAVIRATVKGSIVVAIIRG